MGKRDLPFKIVNGRGFEGPDFDNVLLGWEAEEDIEVGLLECIWLTAERPGSLWQRKDMSQLFMYREKRKKRERAVMEMTMAQDEAETEKQDVRERRTSQQRVKRVLAASSKHLEQLTKQTRRLAGEEEEEMQGGDGGAVVLDAAKNGLLNLKQRHGELRERLSAERATRDPLPREVDFAVLKSTECEVDGESWNDEVITTLWQRVETDACYADSVNEGGADIASDLFSEEERISYRVGARIVICGLPRRRIGIRFETSFGGQAYESYYCALTSEESSDKLTVCEQTVPFFLSMDGEKAFLATSPKQFIDKIDGLLQAYVARRQQLSLLRETRGDQVVEVYHSLPYNLVEFSLELPDAMVSVVVAYDDLLWVLPNRCNVTAWQLEKEVPSAPQGPRRVKRGPAPVVPHALQAAETALQNMHLHESYEQIVADVHATVVALESGILMSPGLG